MLPEEQNSPQSGKKELNQIGVGGIKSLRTFQGDVAEALGKNTTTVAQMAIAENVRKAEGEVKAFQAAQASQSTQQNQPAQQVPPPMTIRPPEVITNGPAPVEHSGGGRKIILTLFSILLLSGGIFGGLYFYSKSPLANLQLPDTPTKTGYRGLLASNTQKKVVLGTLVDKRLEDLLAYEKTAARLEQDQVSELYFTKGPESQPTLITAEEFISLSTTRSPETVRRSLLTRFMFGFHKTSATIEPYLVLKTEFFQNTFTGMLKWEPDLYADTKTWLSDKQVIDANTFEDRILKNKDVRILKDTSGNIAIIYGFLDRETLLITTNEETFLEIIDRFEKQTYVR
ncbi:MAG: hypothetical protein KBD47_01525 [Candidatus Pacebacteria bacterium]|nr:hypothetical protein [Candidatus Paceibacterota bacterium]